MEKRPLNTIAGIIAELHHRAWQVRAMPTSVPEKERKEKMQRRIYAWVKSETCTGRDAVLPGSRVGRNAEPVSRHGDWNPWLWGKRETLAIIALPAMAHNVYRRTCALKVAELLNWIS